MQLVIFQMEQFPHGTQPHLHTQSLLYHQNAETILRLGPEASSTTQDAQVSKESPTLRFSTALQTFPKHIFQQGQGVS